MRASNHVSFDGKYSTEHSPSEPAGKELAAQISTTLVSEGIKTLNSYQTDYSHGIIVSVSGVKFYVEVGPVGDKNANWLAYFGVRFSILGIMELISGKKHCLLANALNNSLQNNNRISNIRWYKNQHAWNYNSEIYSGSP